MKNWAILTEHNALKMHAVIMSSNPPVIYWNQTTIELIHFVKNLRQKGLPAYFTIDAGPQIKIITLPPYVSKLRNEFNTIPGIEEIIESKLGQDVRLSEESR